MINPFLNNETDFDGKGKSGTATKNTTTDIDLKITYNRIINGGFVVTENAVMGDTITCQVVDVDNILGYGAGIVVNTWLTDWPIDPVNHIDLIIEQAGEVPAGLYLRLKYTSIGTVNDVAVGVGYRLYKVVS